MRAVSFVVVALFLGSALSGCMGLYGGAGDDRFELYVEVVGFDHGIQPVAGAIVSIGGTTKATDADGITRFPLSFNQTITIDVEASGWHGTSSVEVDIGNVTEKAGGVFQRILAALGCAFSFGGVCLQRQAILLDGESATLTFQLVRPERHVRATIDTGTVIAADAGVGLLKPWLRQPMNVSADPQEQRLYMMHIDTTESSLVWTNGVPHSGGDFDVGAGCSERGPPDASSSEGNTATWMLDEGAQNRTLAWEPPRPPVVGTTVNKGWASIFIDEEPCPLLYAGPIVHHSNLDTQVELEVAFTFQARTQVPLVDGS